MHTDWPVATSSVGCFMHEPSGSAPPPTASTPDGGTSAVPSSDPLPPIDGAQTDNTSHDDLLFKGLKRLHEEEQMTPIRDSDGNTCPYPVADPNAIRRGPKPLPQLPHDRATSSVGSLGGGSSQVAGLPQSAPVLTQQSPASQSPQEPRSTASRVARQLPSRRLTSPPAVSRAQGDPAPTPLYSSVRPAVQMSFHTFC